MISCDADQHALVLCADGGVVYYSAGAVPGDGSAEGGAAVLLELPSLSRAKEQQQHPGSWALRRVGQDGWLVRRFNPAHMERTMWTDRPTSFSHFRFFCALCRME